MAAGRSSTRVVPAVASDSLSRSLPSLRWPANRRLCSREEFDRVLGRGKALRGNLLQLNYAPSGLPHLRLGFIVGKRQLPSSVDRNHCRRVVREAVRESQARLGGLDIVVRLRRGYDRKSRPALDTEIRELLSRINA